MNPLLLFTDGSMHPASRIGYGAYLLATDPTAAPETMTLPDPRVGVS